MPPDTLLRIVGGYPIIFCIVCIKNMSLKLVGTPRKQHCLNKFSVSVLINVLSLWGARGPRILDPPGTAKREPEAPRWLQSYFFVEFGFIFGCLLELLVGACSLVRGILRFSKLIADSAFGAPCSEMLTPKRPNMGDLGGYCVCKT